MTRFIDADKITDKAIKAYTECVEGVRDMIDHQETVDAIPVSFITFEACRLFTKGTSKSVKESQTLSALIGRWRECEKELER